MSITDCPETAYGCLFCRTGNEEELARLLQRDNPEIRIVVAEKMRRRRQGRMNICEKEKLFPGYLFFEADAGFQVRRFTRMQDVFRVLHTENGQWQLCGADKSFARKLFESEGVIGFSKAYYEGDRIRIVDGMLKEYEGRIKRVNRRAQTAQISIGVCGQETTVWLGFELIEKNDPRAAETYKTDTEFAEKKEFE